MAIQSLIDKQDNFEIVRDQIAAILALETSSQQALATAAAEDPALWAFDVYTERTNAWERWLNQSGDQTPIVNVWYDSATVDESASTTVQRQKMVGTFNIDCMAIGVAADNPLGGHVAGDKAASENSQRIARLVRNILMSGEYRYLGLRGTVWHFMPQSITTFQPQIDDNLVQQIVATRIALRVEYNELAPEHEPAALDYLSIEVGRTSDGQIIVTADYDYTA